MAVVNVDWFATGPLIAFALSIVIVQIMIVVASRRQWLDVPNQRSNHKVPTPRLGGVGFLLASITTLGLIFSTSSSDIDPRLAALLSGFVLISLLGLSDDLRGIPTLVRLLTQLAIATLVAWKGVLPALPFLPPSWSFAASILVAVLWMTWTTNLFNFMDGSDGLAGMQTILTSVIFACLLGQQIPGSSLVLGILCGAMGGFLLHNISPARIFLGDSASTSIGFLFGGLGLIATNVETVHPVSGLLAIHMFFVDATYTLIRRIIARENFWTAHSSHCYQKLIGYGFSHRHVLLIYSGLAAVCGAITLLLPALAPRKGWFVVGILYALSLAGAYSVNRGIRARVPRKFAETD